MKNEAQRISERALMRRTCTAEREYNYKQKERPKINQIWK